MDKSKLTNILFLLGTIALLAVLFIFFMPHRLNSLVLESGEPELTGAIITVTQPGGESLSFTLESLDEDTRQNALGAIWEYLGATKGSFRGRYTAITVTDPLYSVHLISPAPATADEPVLMSFSLMEGSALFYVHDAQTGGHKYSVSHAGADRLIALLETIVETVPGA